MEKCTKCGLTHCCHQTTVVEVLSDPDNGVEFRRENCAGCGSWMGDTVLTMVLPAA